MADGKTPFDSMEITMRQNGYTDRFQLDSVYTPQMVVNGRVQFVGSDSQALVQAVVHAQQSEQAPSVKIDSVKVDGNAVVAILSVAGEVSNRGADLFTVIAQDETSTNITAGENKGRTLTHASVARTYQKAATVHIAGETTVRIPLPGDLMTTTRSRRHLIVWAQEPKAGPVLAVDTMAF